LRIHCLWQGVAIVLVENLVMLAFGIVCVPRFGAAGMALAYLLASVVLPVWLLPRLMSRQIRLISELAAT
jgi:hypothetical protein